MSTLPERNHAREELAQLEGVIEILGPYAEDRELIVEWPPHHFQSARFDDRCEKAANALMWLCDEIKLARKRLKGAEADALVSHSGAAA